jgi:putative FmdB family regulatory protein
LPKYDYRCSAGHQYEKREGFDAPAVQTCTVCGIEARRVLTPPAIVFKGSGWYATDSRNGSKSAATAGSADGAGEAKADTGSDAKAETKSEAKTEAKVDKPASSATTAAAAD